MKDAGAIPFWGSSVVVEMRDFSPNVAVFANGGAFLALGGYGWGRVLRSDGSLVWEGLLLSAGADDDAGVVDVAAVSASGRWALFVTNFHTGSSGSRGLFLVDTERGETFELDADLRREPRAAAFTADERHVVVATSAGRFAFDLESRAEVKPPRGALDLRAPLDQDEETIWASPGRRSRYVLDERGMLLVEGRQSTVLKWPKHLGVDPAAGIRVFDVTTDGSRLVAANDRTGMATEIFVLSTTPPTEGKARRRVKLAAIASRKATPPAPKPVDTKTKPAATAAPTPNPKPRPTTKRPTKELKVSKLARCTANARTHEARGALWPAAIWAAGACAARGGAAATAELERIAARLRDDGTALDGPLVEVFSLFEDAPHALWKALSRLQSQAPARREELAFHAVCTWLADTGDDEKRARALLDVATERFASWSTVWFCSVLMRDVREGQARLSLYRRGVACLARGVPSSHERQLERYALRANGPELSLRGRAAVVTCMRLRAERAYDQVLELVADATAEAARPTPTDRVLLLEERAQALAKLGRPGEAADALRQALDLHAREKLEVYFPRGLYLGQQTGLLAAAGRLDEALGVFSDLLREEPDDARRLWTTSSRVSGEPRFAVALCGLTAAPARETIEAQLARAKKHLRKGETGEALDLTTPAVAGASMRDDSALLAQALLTHSEALPTVHADADVAVPPLKRALSLAKDAALRKTIERALRVERD